MDDIVARGLLYDFYGELLTERRRLVYEDYAYHDLTLSEIAIEYGISRQAAYDMIKRCDHTLQGYEDKLGLVARFLRMREQVEELKRLAVAGGAGDRIGEIADAILRDCL